MVDRKFLPLVLLFSMLAVWSLWNLFSKGVIALGFNFSLFWIGVATILYTQDRRYRLQQDWVWLWPALLIILSYSLYENPWLKLVSLFLLPVIVGVFCAYSHLPSRDHYIWNGALFYAIAARFLKPLASVSQVLALLPVRSRMVPGIKSDSIVSRVLHGIVILIPVALFALWMLSSADAAFAELVFKGIRSLLNNVSWLSLWKLSLSILLAIALLSIAVGWSGEMEHEQAAEQSTIDGLVAGIVLGGLLFIYVLFLLLQLDNIVIEELPENYRQAELMVKSGFWQLFALAVLNTGLFFRVYRKTNLYAQWVLRIFIIASSMLMLSAARKVGLYSYTFGLSYEKFFACYTAVFALGVLLYLVLASFSSIRRNVVKTIAFAALWGYSVATITPVEKVIFHANLYFAEQDNTRITIDQLTQLSLDIKNVADKNYLSRLAIDPESMIAWRQWWQYQQNIACKRPWYEFNFSAIRACKMKSLRGRGAEKNASNP